MTARFPRPFINWAKSIWLSAINGFHWIWKAPSFLTGLWTDPQHLALMMLSLLQSRRKRFFYNTYLMSIMMWQNSLWGFQSRVCINVQPFPREGTKLWPRVRRTLRKGTDLFIKHI